ncbi:MAG: hypothetical protein ABII01_03810 [Candidatus Woesearchaeota archaeon]
MIKRGAIIIIVVLIVIAIIYVKVSDDDSTDTTMPEKKFPTIEVIPDVTSTTIATSVISGIEDTTTTTIRDLPSITTTTLSNPQGTIPVITTTTLMGGTKKIIVKYREFSENELIINKGDTIMFEPDDPVRFFKIACYFDGVRFFSSENIYDKEIVEVSFDEIGSYTCIDAIYGPRLSIEVK